MSWPKGCGVGVSWVSQVERGRLEANAGRKEQLAALFGDELRERPSDGRQREQSQAYVTVWRLRADLLFNVAVGTKDRKNRQRLLQLRRDLVSAARSTLGCWT